MRRKGEDQLFRERIANHRQIVNETNERLKKQARAAQNRSRLLRESKKNKQNPVEQSIADSSRAVATPHTDAEQEECLEYDFIEAPKDFALAIQPVIKRGLKKHVASAQFVFGFLDEDIEVANQTFAWQDTVVIRYKEAGKSIIKKAYLTYKPDWKNQRAAKTPRHQYLQMSYTFELGEETTFKSLTEGIEQMEEFVLDI